MKKRLRKKMAKKYLRYLQVNAAITRAQMIALGVQSLVSEIKMRANGTWVEGGTIVRATGPKDLPLNGSGENGKEVIVDLHLQNGSVLHFGRGKEPLESISMPAKTITLQNPKP